MEKTDGGASRRVNSDPGKLRPRFPGQYISRGIAFELRLEFEPIRESLFCPRQRGESANRIRTVVRAIRDKILIPRLARQKRNRFLKYYSPPSVLLFHARQERAGIRSRPWRENSRRI